MSKLTEEIAKLSTPDYWPFPCHKCCNFGSCERATPRAASGCAAFCEKSSSLEYRMGMLSEAQSQRIAELEAELARVREQRGKLLKAMNDFGGYAKVIVGDRFEGKQKNNHAPTNEYMDGFDDEFMAFEKCHDAIAKEIEEER